MTNQRGIPDEPYELGDGYNHVAVTVDDIDAALARLTELRVEPEKPPYHPGDRDELPRVAARRTRRLLVAFLERAVGARP